MNKKKERLLIISGTQFGYHIDSYYYCKYLRDKYNVTYIGFNQDKPLFKMDNVSIVLVNAIKSKTLKYITECSKIIKTNEIILLRIHKYSFIFRLLFPTKKIILDIRTCSVSDSYKRRRLDDAIMRFNTFFFKRITVISSGVAKRLKLNSTKVSIIPLGGEMFASGNKEFKKLKLLYVGTYNSRRIEDCIIGFAKYNIDNPESEFFIVGSGNEFEQKKIENLVDKLGNINIHLEGFVKQENLSKYFEYCNVGVVYVPITNYYNYQPSTKLFEYILSGLPVIATATYENIKYISNDNGVIIQDNSVSFFNGMIAIEKNKGIYKSNKIKKNAQRFKWQNIVNDVLSKEIDNAIM